MQVIFSFCVMQVMNSAQNLPIYWNVGTGFQTTLNHWSFHLWLWNIKICGTLIRNCLRIDLHLLDLNVLILWYHVNVLACNLVKLFLAHNLTTFLSSVVIDNTIARIKLFCNEFIVLVLQHRLLLHRVRIWAHRRLRSSTRRV